MPIRVLCVFSLLDRGGAESMCMNLFRNIDRNLVQFDFVKHTSKTCDFEKEIRNLGGRIYEAPQYKIYNHFAYCEWWDRFFKKHPEYKIVHGHYYTTSPIYFKVAKKNNRITIGHSHSSSIDGKIKELLIRNVQKYSDYCFACSNEAGKWLFPDRKRF